jgi:hypothetical protein
VPARCALNVVCRSTGTDTATTGIFEVVSASLTCTESVLDKFFST